MIVQKRYERISLFMDYENCFNSLQKRLRTISHIYGYTPKIDFIKMVESLNAWYGPLNRSDFIAVANFSHYDSQKGGLNKVAKLVHVDSFETRKVRQIEQPAPGMKFVMKDYADIRMAFEVGLHTSSHPTELYILASGDKVFSAVGSALMQMGFDVVFLLPDPDAAAIILKDEFTWIDFMDTQEKKAPEGGQSISEGEQPEQKNDVIDEFTKIISKLRHEFTTPIPQNLVKAIFGTQVGTDLIQKAQGQGRIDLWTDPSGVVCLSLQEERMYGKVVPMQTRVDFIRNTEILYRLVKISESGIKEPTPAHWRKLLQDELKLSSREAKDLLNQLIEMNIIRHGSMEKVLLNTDKAVKFLKQGLIKTRSE